MKGSRNWSDLPLQYTFFVEMGDDRCHLECKRIVSLGLCIEIIKGYQIPVALQVSFQEVAQVLVRDAIYTHKAIDILFSIPSVMLHPGDAIPDRFFQRIEVQFFPGVHIG